MKHTTIKSPTPSDYKRAADLLDGCTAPPQTDGEVWAVLDAAVNGDDPMDAIDEYRYWRSPAGVRDECPGCGDLAHATETDDDGYHAGCR